MRLHGRFCRPQDAGRSPLAIDPVGPSLALNRLAALWGLIPPEAVGKPPPVPMQADVIVAQAEKLGLSAGILSRDLHSLRTCDFPCLIVTLEGLCHLALGLAADGTMRIAGIGNGEPELTATINDIAITHSGVVITLSKDEKQFDPLSRDDVIGASSASASQPGRYHLLIGHLREALAGQRQLVMLLALSSFAINVVGLLLPMFSMVVFDRVIPHGAFETLWALALGVCLALAVEFGLRYARLKLADGVSLAVSHRLQGRAMSRVLGSPVAALPRASGAMVQPMQDLDNLAQVAPAVLVGLLVDLPFFLLLISLIASLGGSIVYVPLVAAVLLIAIHALAHLCAHREQKRQGGLIRRQQQFTIDALSAPERIRITGAAGYFLSRYAGAQDDAGFATHISRYWHGLATQAAAVIIQLAAAATIVIGVFRIDAATMTIGALSAAIMLVSRCLTPVSITTGLVFRAWHVLEAAAPLADLLATPLESGGDRRSLHASAIAGAFDARNLSFRYPGEARDNLVNLSISIHPGERVAIIGKTGSGKSTLLRMLVRLHDPSSGVLRLDDRDIRHYDPTTLRRAIGYMPQQADLIDATLEENMTLGLEEISPPQFELIAKLSGAHTFARSHPSGYSMRVGPAGQRLSGGERQSVMLARALMGDPAVLLLDEPTASLDNGTEARLIGELGTYLGRRGLIIATHRLQMLALVERVIWMDDGRIVADGPKAEVLAKLGVAA